MIILFTDYGLEGPYIGQVEAVIHQQAPGTRVINLFADVPRHKPKAGAYLLAAFCKDFPEGTIFFCVVDPGVGTFVDKPVVLKVDNRWFVGPDNGLFDMVARTGNNIHCWEITWRPEKLSNSFHGRDLYAPVCARLANGEDPPGDITVWQDKHAWPDDCYEIIYIDHFGNAMTGLHADQINKNAVVTIGDKKINHADTFSCVDPGQIFWYENANGLVEIALNHGSAADVLALTPGDEIAIDS